MIQSTAALLVGIGAAGLGATIQNQHRDLVEKTATLGVKVDALQSQTKMLSNSVETLASKHQHQIKRSIDSSLASIQDTNLKTAISNVLRAETSGPDQLPNILSLILGASKLTTNQVNDIIRVLKTQNRVPSIPDVPNEIVKDVQKSLQQNNVRGLQESASSMMLFLNRVSDGISQLASTIASLPNRGSLLHELLYAFTSAHKHTSVDVKSYREKWVRPKVRPYASSGLKTAVLMLTPDTISTADLFTEWIQKTYYTKDLLPPILMEHIDVMITRMTQLARPMEPIIASALETVINKAQHRQLEIAQYLDNGSSGWLIHERVAKCTYNLRVSAALYPTQAAAYLRMLKSVVQRLHGNSESAQTFHNVIVVGPPGTGKTTLAKQYHAWLEAFGVCSGGYYEISGRDLVGSTPADSAMRVQMYMMMSLNGVLFVDEAYTMCTYPSTPAQRTAVDQLVYWMEIFRGVHTVILAGYEERMMEVFECNPGLLRRFNYRIKMEVSKDVSEIARTCANELVRADSVSSMESLMKNQFDKNKVRSLVTFLEEQFNHEYAKVPIQQMAFGVIRPVLSILRAHGVSFSKVHLGSLEKFDQDFEMTYDDQSHRWESSDEQLRIESVEQIVKLKLKFSNNQRDIEIKIKPVHDTNQWKPEAYLQPTLTKISITTSGDMTVTCKETTACLDRIKNHWFCLEHTDFWDPQQSIGDRVFKLKGSATVERNFKILSEPTLNLSSEMQTFVKLDLKMYFESFVNLDVDLFQQRVSRALYSKMIDLSVTSKLQDPVIKDKLKEISEEMSTQELDQLMGKRISQHVNYF